jgi:hypothetical protein
VLPAYVAAAVRFEPRVLMFAVCHVLLLPQAGAHCVSLCLQAVLDSEQHSISYAVSGSQTVIVEYMPDEDTDMFQVRFGPSQRIRRSVR